MTTPTRPSSAPAVLRLRAWQRAALDQFLDSDGPDFLAVATPGAGKTTFALTAARHILASDPDARLVVVAPTSHLKFQWADAASRFGIDLEPNWSSNDSGLPDEVDGIATTYQQVATSARSLRKLCKSAFVVFDEVHHAGEDKAWGDAVLTAFEPAAHRLALSGTPFRSDSSPIPFVHYGGGDEAVADFDYGYGPALADGGVVRPVYFPRFDGHMEWSAPDGIVFSATFDDPLDRQRSNQRLRTALSPRGDWMPTVLGQAHEQLMRIRRDEQPRAGALAIAIDLEHARSIAEILRVHFGVRATIALSDDPKASDRISQFADSDAPWIIAVRMISEGVDIPRLRIGVFATTTTTELFFRQAVGRLVRLTPDGGSQRAFMFIPDDSRLRTWAEQIAQQRRHSLRKRLGEEDDGSFAAELDDVGDHEDDGEQLSLFDVLSAVTLSSGPPELTVFDSTFEEIPPARDDTAFDIDDEDLVVELTPLPGRSMRPITQGTSPRREREALRDKNTEVVRELVALTGNGHGKVNAELNRRSGVPSVAEAGRVQLRQRLNSAEQWRRELSGHRSPWRVS
ncbi:MAG: DEAD/DEAH box helicase [Actinomycetia bacterium]|nr:DEAD/DEAH box helicase [Actinomycetes bacterium]MCP4960788.1 DEAD/DEAH box helicase [Actinomycetes bacterium]